MLLINIIWIYMLKALESKRHISPKELGPAKSPWQYKGSLFVLSKKIKILIIKIDGTITPAINIWLEQKGYLKIFCSARDH